MSIRQASALALQRGYTLIEMLVVLGILSLVAALAFPASARSIAHIELTTDARKFALVLRKLSIQAEAQGKTVTISTDPRTRQLRVTGASDWRPEIAHTLFLKAGTANIRLFPDGTSSGGEVVLADNGARLTIHVAWLTGRVSIGSE